MKLEISELSSVSDVYTRAVWISKSRNRPVSSWKSLFCHHRACLSEKLWSDFGVLKTQSGKKCYIFIMHIIAEVFHSLNWLYCAWTSILRTWIHLKWPILLHLHNIFFWLGSYNYIKEMITYIKIQIELW